MKKILGALVVGLLMGAGAQAGSVKATVARVADMNADGSGQRVVPASDVNRILGYHDKAGNVQLVYVLKMTGAADPSKIASANLSVSQLSTATGFKIDAKIIRTAANAKVLASDYQTKALMLMEDFSDNSKAGSKSLDATGQANLVTYLKQHWAEGGYLFIGLQSDPVTLAGKKSAFAKFADDGALTVTVAP
jgi:hypothetical protein